MQALVVNKIGEPSEVLQFSNMPGPAPGPGALLMVGAS